MIDPSALIGLALGLVLGAALAYLVARRLERNAFAQGRAESQASLSSLEATLSGRDAEVARLNAQLLELTGEYHELLAQKQQLAIDAAQLRTTLEKDRENWQEKLTGLELAEQKLAATFKSLSADALRSNSQQFLEQYQAMTKRDFEVQQKSIGDVVAPVKASLEKVDAKIGELEKAREGAYQALHTQIGSLLDSQRFLQQETSSLVKALRQPAARGRWGEIQLRRVVELAGMLNYCDFTEQESFSTEDGRVRPDLIVKLPGGRSIVVDAKAPLGAYLDALEARDEDTRHTCLANHARQIRDHIAALAKKAYHEHVQPAPEFVVLFIPGEMFFSAALEKQPDLIEFGAEKKIIIATPTSLIALLRAVAFGWRQEQIAANAGEISRLGRELHGRLATLGEHWSAVGRGLEGAVDSYNRAVGSLESRVLVTARKFRDLDAGAGDAELPALSPVHTRPRELASPEPPTLPRKG
ncbi:MAG TPA: DNA recombination protein RmuC, partial [Steroidobacteraceae bacterium]